MTLAAHRLTPEPEPDSGRADASCLDCGDLLCTCGGTLGALPRRRLIPWRLVAVAAALATLAASGADTVAAPAYTVSVPALTGFGGMLISAAVAYWTIRRGRVDAAVKASDASYNWYTRTLDAAQERIAALERRATEGEAALVEERASCDRRIAAIYATLGRKESGR